MKKQKDKNKKKEENFDLSEERKKQISKTVRRVLEEHKKTFEKLSKE